MSRTHTKGEPYGSPFPFHTESSHSAFATDEVHHNGNDSKQKKYMDENAGGLEHQKATDPNNE